MEALPKDAPEFREAGPLADYLSKLGIAQGADSVGLINIVFGAQLVNAIAEQYFGAFSKEGGFGLPGFAAGAILGEKAAMISHVTSFVVKQLEEYAVNRDAYPRFTDFVPALLERLAQEARVVKRETVITKAVLYGFAALALGGVWLVHRRRKPRCAPADRGETDAGAGA